MRYLAPLCVVFLASTASYSASAGHIENAAERQAHVVQRAILRISSEDDLDMVEVLGTLNTDAARNTMVNLASYNLGEAVMDALQRQVREQGAKLLPFIIAALRNPEKCDPYFIHMQQPVTCRTTEATREVLKRWQSEIEKPNPTLKFAPSGRWDAPAARPLASR